MNRPGDPRLGKRWHVPSARLTGLVPSVGLHALIVGSVALAPFIGAADAEPIEFVAIEIVPLQALGVSRPEPQPEPPAPEPEPVLAEPEPETPRPRDPEPAPKPEPAREEPATRPAPEPVRKQRQGSPRGNAAGTSSFGASVAGLDNPDFVYSYYVDQMLGMIAEQWQRPALGGTVEAIVHFRIARDGRMSDLRIVQSSSYNSFDLAGLRAVQQAAPFPPLPQSYRHDSIGVNLILR